jgi:hypothetical protein
MTLTEINYMLLEIIRKGHIVDDERLSSRLISKWVNQKRGAYIRKNRNTNPNNRTNLNIYQSLPITVSVESTTDAGNYPYLDEYTQLYSIVESTIDIPSIMEDKSGPIIYSIESEDKFKLPFSIVNYDHLRFSGNGKFNKNIIFTAIRDNKLYFKYNNFFDTYTNVILKAVFKDPTELNSFNEDTSEYPISNMGLEYLKTELYNTDIRMFLSGITDEINDASGEIK